MFEAAECRTLPRTEVSKKMHVTRKMRLYNEDLRNFGFYWTKNVEKEVDAVRDQVCGK
jgi:hypothetical protein